MRLVVPVALVIAALAGCESSSRSDAGVPCRLGDIMPSGLGECVSVYSAHWCSDVNEFSCIDGVWQCPGGISPPGSCWCYGAAPHGATCGPHGWVYAEAGPGDAGAP